MPHPQLNIYLTNNPHCTTTWRVAATGEVVKQDIFPNLAADFRDLPADGSWQIEAAVFDRNGNRITQQESVAQSENGRLTHLWTLDEPLESPWTVRMWARQGSYLLENTSPLPIYKVYGRVTYFDGTPAANTSVNANGVPGGCAVKTDDDGYYTLWVPNRHIPEFCAADDDYGLTTLECWAYDYRPQGDLRLDMRIGELELYELKAWHGYCGIKADFLPMSVSLVNAWLRDRTGILKFCPDLESSDISAELDGKPVDILTVNKRNELCREAEVTHMRDEYALQIDAPKPVPGTASVSPKVLRVTVEHKYEDRDLVERGEAFYLGLR